MCDAFISHKSERKPWVRILSENLKKAGMKIFFDEWDFIAGRYTAAELEDALRASRGGILVATPEIASSGWIREEYARMFGLRQQNPDFFIIPIQIGSEISDMPFLSNLLFVEFPGRDEYRDSFHRLLCALRGQAPGRTSRFDGE